MVYPHDATCFGWDRQGRLVCTVACRRHHHRAWKIRHGCLPGRQRWTIYRHAGSGHYAPVAGADSFARAVVLLSRPLVAPGEGVR